MRFAANEKDMEKKKSVIWHNKWLSDGIHNGVRRAIEISGESPGNGSKPSSENFLLGATPLDGVFRRLYADVLSVIFHKHPLPTSPHMTYSHVRHVIFPKRCCHLFRCCVGLASSLCFNKEGAQGNVQQWLYSVCHFSFLPNMIETHTTYSLTHTSGMAWRSLKTDWNVCSIFICAFFRQSLPQIPCKIMTNGIMLHFTSKIYQTHYEVKARRTLFGLFYCDVYQICVTQHCNLMVSTKGSIIVWRWH